MTWHELAMAQTRDLILQGETSRACDAALFRLYQPCWAIVTKVQFDAKLLKTEQIKT